MSNEAINLALEALEFFKGLSLSMKEIERAEEAITALREAREKEALHKLAAESLNDGLRLDDWDKIGCVNHDCDKCKAQQEPLTDADYYNACLSYRHDFGLMSEEERQKLVFEAKEWARAFGITKGNT